MRKYIKIDNNDLKGEIEKKYDIDLESYKNPEITAKIGDIIFFPKYAFKNILSAVVLANICFFLPCL